MNEGETCRTCIVDPFQDDNVSDKTVRQVLGTTIVAKSLRFDRPGAIHSGWKVTIIKSVVPDWQ